MASQTVLYGFAQRLRSGTATLEARFHAAPDGGGALVGTASGTVTLGTNVDLASIVTNAVIRSVTVPDVSIAEDAPATQLQFSARDADGNIVAVSPGSARWTLTGGSSVISLGSDGIAVPAATGTASVIASLDGLSSAPATITVVTPPPSPGTVRIENGPLNYVRGVSVDAVTGSKLIRTFRVRLSDGTVETIQNALAFDNFGVNDDVFILRQGAQPVKASFPVASNRFYAYGNRFNQNFIPINSEGVFQTSLVMRDTSGGGIDFQGTLVVNGLTLSGFSIYSYAFSGVTKKSEFFPLSYHVDIPLIGQPMSLIRGRASYSPGLAQYRHIPDVIYSNRRFEQEYRLGIDGTIAYSNASSNDQTLAQGSPAVYILLRGP